MLASAWRLTAASLLRQGYTNQANQAIENAWIALAEGPDRLENGRLHAQAYRIALALNNPEQAQQHRQAAESLFTELGAARDLALLQALDNPEE